EKITGVIVVLSGSDIKHEGISLCMEGTVNLQLSAKNVGIFEAFYNSVKVTAYLPSTIVLTINLVHNLVFEVTVLELEDNVLMSVERNCKLEYDDLQPIQLVSCVVEVAAAGKIPAGKTEIPFEFPLTPRPTKTLYETYHGVFVNVQYLLKCEMKRGFLAKDLIKVAEFIVEYKSLRADKAESHPVQFSITPESLQNMKDRARIPRFKVTGRLDSTMCCLAKPFTGDLVVEHCELPIKSVEIQLVRVETCGCAEGYAKDGQHYC
ncbi:hypothetical protein PR048_004419, partial [Dryococelus australis]